MQLHLQMELSWSQPYGIFTAIQHEEHMFLSRRFQTVCSSSPVLPVHSVVMKPGAGLGRSGDPGGEGRGDSLVFPFSCSRIPSTSG